MKETCKKSGLSEPYPEFVARFYDVIYAKVRSAADLDYYLRFFREMCGKIEKVSNLSYGRHSTIHANTWHTAALGD